MTSSSLSTTQLTTLNEILTRLDNFINKTLEPAARGEAWKHVEKQLCKKPEKKEEKSNLEEAIQTLNKSIRQTNQLLQINLIEHAKMHGKTSEAQSLSSTECR